MPTLLFLLILTLILAALGRAAIPRAERVPLRAWRWPDLLANIARGGRVLWTLHEGHCRLWETYLNELQPWHPPRHSHRPASTRADDAKKRIDPR